MPLIRNFGVQPGDQTALVVPVFDGGDTSNTFWPDLDGEDTTVQVSIQDDWGLEQTTLVATEDVDIDIEAFGAVDIENEDFDFSGVRAVEDPDDFEIPSGQDVIVIEIPATKTREWEPTPAGEDGLTYQVWVVEDADGTDKPLTPVRGRIEVGEKNERV